MPADTAENSRLNSFKNRGKDMDEFRRRRNVDSVEIRKAKKDDHLTKKRQMGDLNLISPLKENNQQSINIPLMNMEDIIRILSGKANDDDKFKAVQSVRRLLSKEKNPPIDKVIKAGLVPSLISLLGYSQNTSIQFEAAWAVTNIASGTSEQTRTVVEAGCVQQFLQLLYSDQTQVCEQAVWALGNIAGDGPQYRDIVINCGCVAPLIKLASDNIPVAFLRNVTWTISNLCRNKNPPPDLQKILPLLGILAKLIMHHDEEIVADTCWALSYLTDGPNEKIDTIIQTGVVSKLVELLGHQNVSLVTPSLRAVGNIVTGDDKQTQYVLDQGALPYLRELLSHSKSQLIKESTWAISNIAAGTVGQVTALFEAEIIKPIIHVLETSDFKIQKEAIWVVTNLTSSGDLDHIFRLIQCNAIKPLCDMLKIPDTKTIMVALDGMRNILSKAQQMPMVTVDGVDKNVLVEVKEMIELVGGLDELENLQTHENDTIGKLAYDLVDNFFSVEDEEDDMVAPTMSNEGYKFSTATDNPFNL